MNTLDPVCTEQRVRFGTGLRHDIATEVLRLGCSRALVLTTPEQSKLSLELAADLGSQAAGVCSTAAMHTPVDVTEDALAHALDVNADCLVAVGGGSTTGLSKALALRANLPQIVIPTTYAGSEATPILGQTENGIKTTVRDQRVLPDVVLYDPELVVTLPTAMSATSGLNAMAHAVEALYARDRNMASTRLAVEGLEAFVTALPRVLEQPSDLEARETTLRGAWACGAVLGRVGMALHHKLCHTLGGSFDMPHAQTHAVILPHATAFNANAVPELLRPITDLLGGTDPGRALWDFSASLGAPSSLQSLGFAQADLEHAADIATRDPYWNPRPIDQDSILALLTNAWAGEAPSL